MNIMDEIFGGVVWEQQVAYSAAAREEGDRNGKSAAALRRLCANLDETAASMEREPTNDGWRGYAKLLRELATEAREALKP